MKYLRVIVLLAVLAAAALIGGSVHYLTGAMRTGAAAWTPIDERVMSHGRFENFTVYAPHGTPRGFVLMLSGADGWSANMAAMAKGLAAQGAMVAGLDLAKLEANLQADGGDCVFPDGDLENLSHFVQAYFRLPTYLSPILAGYSAGGTLAYATLVQAPKNTFAGGVSLEFCPTLGLNKPLCKGSGIEFTSRAGKGVEFLPSTQSGLSWSVVQSGVNSACDAASVAHFVAQVPGARLIAVPHMAGATSTPWSAASASAFDALMQQHPAASIAAVPGELADLPIVTVPATPGRTPSDAFAIILSGDGGWAGLDKEVAGALAEAGIPVIGLDSLRYFWSARTPQGLAADLDRMTRYYLKSLGKERVMLIGYSQGADVLPFAVNRMNATIRSHVALTAVIGLSEHALFEFHMTSWISDDDSGPPTLPEVERIAGMPVLCIYGEGESDTLCPQLDPHKVTIVKLKGGHHFGGDYAGLARTILASIPP